MVVMMIVAVMVVAVIVVVMRGDGQRRRRLCLQRADEAAALGPDQPGAERRDQRVACDLDRLFRPAHGLGGGVEQPGADADHRPPRPATASARRQTTTRCRAGRFPGWRPDRTRSPPCRGRGRRHGKCRMQRRSQAASRPPSRRTSRRGWLRKSRGRIPTALPAASRRCRRPAARRAPGRGPPNGFCANSRCEAPSSTTNGCTARDADRQAAPRSAGPQASRAIHRDLVGEHRAVIGIVAASVKVCSSSFWALALPSFGRWNAIWQVAGAPTSLTGSLSANLKSMKNAGSNTSSASCVALNGVFTGRVKCSVSAASLYSRK